MQISNVGASLSQGKFLDKKQLYILYLGMIAFLLFPLITIIMQFIPQIEWDSQIIITMVGSDMMFLFFLSIYAFVLKKNNQLRKKIIIWLEDAIEINAYSKKIGENRLGFQPKAVKIQVTFMLNGKTYIRESTVKVFGGEKGYLGTYKKYADREIRILYSPKYDEVLILKDA